MLGFKWDHTICFPAQAGPAGTPLGRCQGGFAPSAGAYQPPAPQQTQGIMKPSVWPRNADISTES